MKEKGGITEADYKEVTKPSSLTWTGGYKSSYTYTYGEINTINPDAHRLEVRRMKFKLAGYAYTKELTYLLQVDITRRFSEAPGTCLFQLPRAGRTANPARADQVPFGRQWLNSSGAQQFVDRSTAPDIFRPG